MAKPRFIPLDLAIFKFTNEYEPPDYGGDPKKLFEQIEDLDNTWDKLVAAFGFGAATIGARWIEYSGRFALLCENIRGGRLIAYGLRTKPTVGNAPEQIPAYLFDNPAYFGDEKAIEKSGYRYELIQVSKAPPRKPKVQFADVALSSRRAGRPTKDTEIEDAINSLMKSGFDFSKEHRKASYAAIRERAKKLGSNIEFGFSNPVLQRIIVRRFGIRK